MPLPPEVPKFHPVRRRRLWRPCHDYAINGLIPEPRYGPSNNETRCSSEEHVALRAIFFGQDCENNRENDASGSPQWHERIQRSDRMLLLFNIRCGRHFGRVEPDHDSEHRTHQQRDEQQGDEPNNSCRHNRPLSTHLDRAAQRPARLSDRRPTPGRGELVVRRSAPTAG